MRISWRSMTRPSLEHRAEKWEPVFGLNDATTKIRSIVPKGGDRFSAQTMRQQKIRSEWSDIEFGLAAPAIDGAEATCAAHSGHGNAAALPRRGNATAWQGEAHDDHSEDHRV
jgi:hypothetical protein